MNFSTLVLNSFDSKKLRINTVMSKETFLKAFVFGNYLQYLLYSYSNWKKLEQKLEKPNKTFRIKIM